MSSPSVNNSEVIPLNGIVDEVKKHHPSADVDVISRCYMYAQKMHDGQMRKSGDPYFIHPAKVAGIISKMKLDPASVCAALLHDVVEDTEISEDDIEKEFGSEIASLVDGVTKLGKINFTSREDHQAESFRKMLIAMARDIRVLLVKLADRLDNMRSLEFMRDESQERIANETLEIYAPLAARLGIQWMKSELEDLCLQYLHPEAYRELLEKTEAASQDWERYITDASNQIQQMMIERGFSAQVKGRAKHLYSTFRKMRANNCDFEQVFDLIAFRVITESVGDCYATLGVIHSHWTPVPGRFKDYIALPKPNMYQSLHTTVIGPEYKRIEFQIRTQEMDEVAESGIAAHWKYKESAKSVSPSDFKQFAWLKQLVEVQQELDDPAEFLETVKVDLFHDEVYVFTPNGDVKVFPRGSTPVDFAYSVHSEVGDHCVGARVNDLMVPLRHKLHNGDTVEIITNQNQQPSKGWLDFTVTAKARSRIRAHLRKEEHESSVRLGKELLARDMRKQNVSFGKFMKGEDLKKILKKLKFRQTEEMFSAIGHGRMAASDIVDALRPSETEPPPRQLRNSFFERTVQRVSRKESGSGIRIGGIEDVLVRFGKCCSPVPGDPVMGWITRGRGVSVHRRNCDKAMELDPERRIEVSWDLNGKLERPAALRVVSADRAGILSDVSQIFTSSGVNINEAVCRASVEGRAMNVFRFSVKDVKKLREIMRQLAKIRGVYEVTRV